MLASPKETHAVGQRGREREQTRYLAIPFCLVWSPSFSLPSSVLSLPFSLAHSFWYTLLFSLVLPEQLYEDPAVMILPIFLMTILIILMYRYFILSISLLASGYLLLWILRLFPFLPRSTLFLSHCSLCRISPSLFLAHNCLSYVIIYRLCAHTQTHTNKPLAYFGYLLFTCLAWISFLPFYLSVSLELFIRCFALVLSSLCCCSVVILPAGQFRSLSLPHPSLSFLSCKTWAIMMKRT